MTTWILILVIQATSLPGNTGATSMSAVFQSRQSCENAAKQIKDDKKSWSGTFNVYCFENSPASNKVNE